MFTLIFEIITMILLTIITIIGLIILYYNLQRSIKNPMPVMYDDDYLLTSVDPQFITQLYKFYYID